MKKKVIFTKKNCYHKAPQGTVFKNKINKNKIIVQFDDKTNIICTDNSIGDLRNLMIKTDELFQINYQCKPPKYLAMWSLQIKLSDFLFEELKKNDEMETLSNSL